MSNLSIQGQDRDAQLLCELAQSALASSSVHVLNKLRVEQLDDSLLISGRVDTYYHKQLAQELVRTVAGEYHVVNAVDVD